MSLNITLIVLAAALLHALWNIIVKGGENKLHETGLNALGGGLGALCLLPLLAPPPPEAWPWLAASCVCHFSYYLCVAAAYRQADLSFSYTIMRGCAPLLTSLVMMLSGAGLGLQAWGGILLLCCGILSLAGRHAGGGPSGGWRAFWPPLRTSVFITGYTILDGMGARAAGDAVGYACWIFICNIVPLNAFILWRHGRGYLEYARERARAGILGGLAGLASYGLAIWAMTRAPIALVAALRETSVIFGMLLAVCFLGERFSLRRAMAVGLVAAGVIIMRLA